MADWENQYSLVARWYERSVVSAKNPISSDVVELKDYLYAFFVSCWHLKDWLKADPTIEIDDKVIELHANKDDSAIKVCGDIATVAKHKKVDDPNRDSTASLDGSINITVNMKIDGTSESTLRTGAIILSIRGTKDALEIAQKALEEWEQFFLEHKLRDRGGLMERIEKSVQEKLNELEEDIGE